MGCQIQITKKNAITPRSWREWHHLLLLTYSLTDALSQYSHKQFARMSESSAKKCKGQEFRDHEQIVRQQQKVDFVAATYSHYTFLMNRIE